MRRTLRIAASLAAATIALAAVGMANATVAPPSGPGPALSVTANPGLPAGATVSPTGGERLSILYVTDPGVTEVLGGSEAMRTLPWLFRQEPSNSGAGAQLASNDQRMVKISGAALFGKASANAMTAMLKSAVDRTCVTPAGVNTCGAHRVGVDEIGTEWGEDAPGGLDSKPGMLRAAMRTLQNTPYPGGGTYAARVHFYVAPGMSTAIAAGKGPDRTLGDDGKVHFRNYRGVMAALRRAGGIWLEMYHYPKGSNARRPFSAAEWRTVPVEFATFLRDDVPVHPAPLPRTILHFVMTGGTPPNAACAAAPAGQSAGMACQWGLAQQGSLNQLILGNGPAAFKTSGADAATYGQQFRAFFAVG